MAENSSPESYAISGSGTNLTETSKTWPVGKSSCAWNGWGFFNSPQDETLPLMKDAIGCLPWSKPWKPHWKENSPTSAPLRSAPFIGWSDPIKEQNLHKIAQNTRFLILPYIKIPHLASKLLALNIKRLRQDWPTYYGHPLYLLETFVDQSRFKGTSYQAALPTGL
jgi:hypothetical protein